MDFTILKIPKGNTLACLINIDTLLIDTLFYRLYNNFGLY